MKNVSHKTIARSLIYIRTLERLLSMKRDLVSSKELADIIGLTDVQVRKDISNFGKVGKPRVGYKISDLKKTLEDFILKKPVGLALFGVGNLGAAILKYPGFNETRVSFKVAFDNDPKKIGISFGKTKVYPVKDALKVIQNNEIEIGVIAVSEKNSQGIADIIVKSGIKGILNFSPTTINVPDDVMVNNIDLTIEFLSLACMIRS